MKNINPGCVIGTCGHKLKEKITVDENNVVTEVDYGITIRIKDYYQCEKCVSVICVCDKCLPRYKKYILKDQKAEDKWLK